MTQKPQLSFWQIWNMCFGFLGIQFGFALQNANVSRIFQTLGASIDDIPILWVAAPLTGLIVQPIIGYMTDRTWNRLGRRRPYFLVGAILASLALFVMPNSPCALGRRRHALDHGREHQYFDGAVSRIRWRHVAREAAHGGFAMQTFFIGIGAVVASALPWMMTNWFDVSNIAAPGQVPDSVKLSFYFGGAVFLAGRSLDGVAIQGVFAEELAGIRRGARRRSMWRRCVDAARGEQVSQRRHRLGGDRHCAVVLDCDARPRQAALCSGRWLHGVWRVADRHEPAAERGQVPRTACTRSCTTCFTCRESCGSLPSCSSSPGSHCSRCGSTALRGNELITTARRTRHRRALQQRRRLDRRIVRGLQRIRSARGNRDSVHCQSTRLSCYAT